MKRTLLAFFLVIPFLGFSQLWNFNSSNQDWTKKGSGLYTVATYGTTAGNLHLTVTGNNVTTNNFFVLENLLQGIPSPVINYKFLRVKLTNNSPVNSMIFRADATNPTGASKSIAITNNTTSNLEYLIDLTGIIWPGISPSTSTATPGSAGTFELRFSKTSSDSWQTSQYISIDEIEFMTDIIKNDHLFDTLDSWETENSASNSGTISILNGKLILTPAGGINAKIKNNFYSIDAQNNKFIHIMYKNNSTVNNSLRINYFSSVDYYTVQKQFLNQTISMNGASGELVIDASSIGDWLGNVRNVSLVLSQFDGTVEVPANVNSSTLEIDRIVINNSNTLLSVRDNSLQNDFFMYPNPVEDLLTISTNQEIKGLEIYSLTGQLLHRIENSNSINVSNLHNGVYIVNVYSKDKVSSSRFVKK